VFILCSGRVKLSTTSADGKTLIVRIADQGEVLGLYATVTEKPYELTAEVIEPTQANFIPRQEFLNFLRQHGEVVEIFIKMAKEGSTLSSFMDGLALSISIGLQYGVPLKALVDKLTNTRFEPSGFTENPNIRYSSSVLDYIARWLGGKFLSSEYLKPRAAVNEQELIQAATSASSVSTEGRKSAHPGNGGATTGDAPSCSTCGMLMVPNGSCYKCVNCGGTSGCS